MKIKKYLWMLFVVLIFMPQARIYAQADSAMKNILILEHVKRNRYKIIKEGKKIKYWLKNDKKKHKGRVDSIAVNSFFIGIREFDGSEFSMILARTTGMGIVHASGGVLLGSGLVITILGGKVIIQSPDAEGCLGPGIALAVGIIITATGVAIDLVSLVPLLIANKRYNLEKKWILKIEQVPVNMSNRQIIKKFKGK